MAELKKCPFCGGEAYSDRIGKPLFTIRCTNIDCYAEISKVSYEEAIQSWNNRAYEAELHANVIDEFAEKLKELVSEDGTLYKEYIDEIASQMKGEEECVERQNRKSAVY